MWRRGRPRSSVARLLPSAPRARTARVRLRAPSPRWKRRHRRRCDALSLSATTRCSRRVAASDSDGPRRSTSQSSPSSPCRRSEGRWRTRARRAGAAPGSTTTWLRAPARKASSPARRRRPRRHSLRRRHSKRRLLLRRLPLRRRPSPRQRHPRRLFSPRGTPSPSLAGRGARRRWRARRCRKASLARCGGSCGLYQTLSAVTASGSAARRGARSPSNDRRSRIDAASGSTHRRQL
mmetsp:Transcript_19285/g.65162  ORF Transcript_19285/g.65162 Transcript_19285/m.65162 type:complete len:236 (+) Transcript_19285:279-986(+)